MAVSVSAQPAPPAHPAEQLAWPVITNDNYPAGALKRLEQGAVTVLFTIGAKGRVETCTVTKSSGSQDLDAATCPMIERRARFKPARDAEGKAMVSQARMTMRWTLSY